jgi:HEAT repeat protein
MRKLTVVVTLLAALTGCGQPSSPSGTDDSSVRTVKDWIHDLQNENHMTRLQAAIALGEMGRTAKPAVEALSQTLLNDSNRLVRAQAAWSLVYVDPKGEEALQALGSATRDPDPAVRIKVVEALGKLGPPAEPAVDELIRLLKDRTPEIRIASAQALASIGPKAERAKMYLVQVAEFDGDSKVQAAASEAVKWIDKK